MNYFFIMNYWLYAKLDNTIPKELTTESLL